jgi:hypothetical protein
MVAELYPNRSQGFLRLIAQFEVKNFKQNLDD